MMKAIPVYGRTNRKLSQTRKKKKQLNSDILYFWKLLVLSKDRHPILMSPFFQNEIYLL